MFQLIPCEEPGPKQVQPGKGPDPPANEKRDQMVHEETDQAGEDDEESTDGKLLQEAKHFVQLLESQRDLRLRFNESPEEGKRTLEAMESKIQARATESLLKLVYYDADIQEIMPERISFIRVSDRLTQLSRSTASNLRYGGQANSQGQPKMATGHLYILKENHEETKMIRDELAIKLESSSKKLVNGRKSLRCQTEGVNCIVESMEWQEKEKFLQRELHASNKEGTWYQVRWAGGDPDSDSWINEEDLGGCAELMAEWITLRQRT